jgi:hypothetical protein
MSRARVCAAAVVLAMAASGCVSTPDAADLVREGGATPDLSESDAADALVGYVDLINAALRGESLPALADATDPTCPCSSLVRMIEEGTSGGGAFLDAEFTARDVTVRSVDGPTAIVRARISVSAYDVRTPDGVVVETKPAEEYVADYTLRSDGENWRVMDVVRVEER